MFATRKNKEDNKKHVILGTYGIDTKSFANQINLNMQTCWDILQSVVDLVYSTGDVNGDYIFMRDPNKAVMKLYKKVENEFDEEEDDEEL